MLVLATFVCSSISQPRFGRPRGCLLNRLDVLDCTIRNPARTDVPQPKYVIYIYTLRSLF